MEDNKDIQKELEILELAKYMAVQARADIENCDIDALTIIHRAYNQFCSSNAINGDEVIYDTFYNEDMKQLLDQGFTIWDIQKVAYDEFPYIMIERNPSNEEKQLKSIDGKTRNEFLDEFLLDLMTEIAHFPNDCPEYTAVYDTYMDMDKIYAPIYEELDKCGNHIVFDKPHTLTILRKRFYGESVEDKMTFKAIYVGRNNELCLIDTDFDCWLAENLTNHSLKRLLEIVQNEE